MAASEEVSTKEIPVTNTTELAEAFQLGGALSEIKTTLGFVRGTVEKTDSTVNDMSARLGSIEVTQGRQGEQLQGALGRIALLEGRPEPDIRRSEFTELKNEVSASRLSWPKVGTLVAALAAVAAILAYVSTLTPGA